MVLLGPKSRLAYRAAAHLLWAGIAASAACGAKDERPPALPDEPKGGAAGTGSGPDAADIPDVMEPAEAGGFGPSVLFQPCWESVMMQGGIKADPYFCYVTMPGHPAENTSTRNFLFPIIGFTETLDATDRKILVKVGTYLTWSLTAPDGQMLTAGATYATDASDASDGTALHFAWNALMGDCGTDPEHGEFWIRELEWDASNMVTTAAIDFTHRCGTSAPMYARFRLHTTTPP